MLYSKFSIIRFYPCKVFIEASPFTFLRRSQPVEPDNTWEKTDLAETLRLEGGLSKPLKSEAKAIY